MKTNTFTRIFGLLIIMSLLLVGNDRPILAQMPAIPDTDTDIYYGHEYGVSGIAEALLRFEIYFSASEISNEVTNSIELALNYVWDNRFELNGSQVSSWAKGPEQQSIYPGKKYGAAGIIPAFLAMYNVTKSIRWLDRAISSYWQLSEEALNGSDFPNWPYSYFEPHDDGISLTDLKYGSAGILSVGIDLYTLTGNQSYLEHGVLIAQWLEAVSKEIQIGNQQYRVLPWYNLDGIPGPIKTGYEWGIAGIAPIIYKLGNLVNSDELKQWGLELGQFLVSVQNSDGSWYVEHSSKSWLTGFDEGVAGVVFGLNELRLLSGSNSFDQSIISAINFLYSHYSDQLSLTSLYVAAEGETVYNGLNRGLLGVMKSLVSVQDLLTSEQMDIIISTLEWFLTNELYLILDGSNELLIMDYVDGADGLIDFSYGEGIAGLLVELIEFNSVLITKTINVNLTQAIYATANSIVKFQNPEGYWSRQRTIPSLSTSRLELINSDQSISTPSSFISKTSTQSSTPFIIEILFIGLLTSYLSRYYVKSKNGKRNKDNNG